MDGVDARYLGLTANQLAKIATDLKAENAKLRDLAEMMLLVCKNQGIAGGVFTRLGSNSNLEERVDFESCARELGIEVPK